MVIYIRVAGGVGGVVAVVVYRVGVVGGVVFGLHVEELPASLCQCRRSHGSFSVFLFDNDTTGRISHERSRHCSCPRCHHFHGHFWVAMIVEAMRNSVPAWTHCRDLLVP